MLRGVMRPQFSRLRDSGVFEGDEGQNVKTLKTNYCKAYHTDMEPMSV